MQSSPFLLGLEGSAAAFGDPPNHEKGVRGDPPMPVREASGDGTSAFMSELALEIPGMAKSDTWSSQRSPRCRLLISEVERFAIPAASVSSDELSRMSNDENKPAHPKTPRHRRRPPSPTDDELRQRAAPPLRLQL